jgi:hypothetical protein
VGQGRIVGSILVMVGLMVTVLVVVGVTVGHPAAQIVAVTVEVVPGYGLVAIALSSQRV